VTSGVVKHDDESGPNAIDADADGTAASRFIATPVSIDKVLDFCEMTVDGNYFSGDCATQEEIDSYSAALAAMDYEISAQQQEVID
jgi:hypothetical protein